MVDQLLDAGVSHVDVLDNLVRGRRANLDDALATGRVQLVEGDLRDRDLVHDLTKGKDLVFHQAAIRITQCAEEPRLALEVLVDGTFNVFEAAVQHRVGKVIAASSASVYGMAEEFPTPERHHHHNNDTFYGAAKSFNEGMARSFRAMSGLDYVLLRYFNVYGPRMDVHGLYTEVLVRWMERIVDGLPPLIFGSGTQTMDFVHTEHGPERAVNGVVRRLADTGSARRDLGFEAAVGLEDGLRSLVDWWRPLRREIAASRAGSGSGATAVGAQ